MGYSQAEKADSHQRILDVASRRFRELGLEGISVADVMKEAGMTVGGFYKHFATRDDLVVEAIAAACIEMDDSYLTNQPSLRKGIQAYLSEEHRDGIANGCPISSLMNDVARSSEDARGVYTERMEQSFSAIERQLPDGVEKNRRAKAILIYSALVGALGLARAVPDAKLSRQILNAVSTELVALYTINKTQGTTA